MSDTTVLNVKIDKKLKKQAQEVAGDLGLPVSTLVSSLLKRVVREREITISVEPRLRPEVEKELAELSQATKDGTAELSETFEDVEEFLADLKK